MAIFCLANGLKDLQERLGNIVVGLSRDREPIYARDIKADGAMTVSAEGRADAEPGADAGEQPGLHPWRPVREHRPWL
jgi:hypothetical protein